MEAILDKTIVLACCALALAFAPWNGLFVASFLAAVCAAALAEALPKRWMPAGSLAYSLGAVLAPSVLGAFLPLAVYDLVRDSRAWVRVVWTAPVCIAAVQADPASRIALIAGSAIAAALSLRTAHTQRKRAVDRRLRDSVREQALAVESKCSDLEERQNLEIKLATLAERNRIARDIHDNVGHLLTRSLLQVEALRVTHRGEGPLIDELDCVRSSLSEALDAVRSSVHDLHDEGFDLETQLRSIARSTKPLAVDIDFRADSIPTPVALSFAAVAREAVSNALRHGNADHMRIAVFEHPGFFRLVAKDNGTLPPTPTEYDAPDGLAQAGIGLSTMRDRIVGLGGVLRTSFDQGFTVFASVPRKSGIEQQGPKTTEKSPRPQNRQEGVA